MKKRLEEWRLLGTADWVNGALIEGEEGLLLVTREERFPGERLCRERDGLRIAVTGYAQPLSSRAGEVCAHPVTALREENPGEEEEWQTI